MRKFFIVGCPRSGTTMVQQALNRHSRIAIPPETKFFSSFVGRSRSAQSRHIERLNRDLHICLKPPASRIATVDEGREFYQTMANQYLGALQKRGVTCFGEKTPEHTSRLSSIREHFPKAKILVLYRDGRDVALSLSKTPWMPCGLNVSFLVWLHYQRILLQAKHDHLPSLYFARYEDLVSNPHRGFARILDFLDLPYESAVSEGSGNSEGIPKREYAWKGNALQKITADRVGVFQDELSPAQIAILERLGKEMLTSFDYPLLSDGRAPLSLGFHLSLARDLAGFAWRMPVHLLLQEVMKRFAAGCSARFSQLIRLSNRVRRVFGLGMGQL